jgi:hypothetical protein
MDSGVCLCRQGDISAKDQRSIILLSLTKQSENTIAKKNIQSEIQDDKAGKYYIQGKVVISPAWCTHPLPLKVAGKGHIVDEVANVVGSKEVVKDSAPMSKPLLLGFHQFGLRCAICCMTITTPLTII